MAPLRIAQVITRADTIGGAQVHVLDLAVSLQAQGHTVAVWVGGNGPFVDALEREGVAVHRLAHLVAPIAPHHDLRAIAELRHALARFDADIIGLHSTKAGVVGRLAAWGLRAKVVYTVHGWVFVDADPRGKAAVYRRVEQALAPLADRIIAVSDHDLRLARRTRVGARGQVVAVPNGVRDVDPSLRAAPGDPDATPRLITVARLDVPKDPFTLLRALATMRDRRPQLPWRLDWIGDGPFRAEAEALARSLDLSERVSFEGTCDDVPQRLARAAVMVLPTDAEGMPLSVLEAMRAGLPVVASAVGGIPEQVRDGEQGRLVPPADAPALAEALVELVADPALRGRMGAASRRRYETHFSFDRQCEATLAVYRSVLDASDATSGSARDAAPDRGPPDARA